jgi:hypothetical protein
MTKRRTIVLSLLVAVLMTFALAAPSIWRTASLYWAKSSARRTISKFTPEERQFLDATPTSIKLPSVKLDAGLLETAQLGGYVFRVPRPASFDDKSPSILLVYPRYEVRILRPFSTALIDAGANKLHYKNTFDQFSATYRTRLNDLDAQPDLASLRRFFLLISEKPNRTFCREGFTAGELCGFVMAPVPVEERSLLEEFIPASQLGCGVWFVDRGGLTQADVHEFLAALRIKAMQPKVPISTTLPAT